MSEWISILDPETDQLVIRFESSMVLPNSIRLYIIELGSYHTDQAAPSCSSPFYSLLLFSIPFRRAI